MSTQRWRSFLLVVLWLFGNWGAHAEGSCPPGMYPNNLGSTGGVNGCNPIPGYSNQRTLQPSEQQWERRWGAIATSTQDGILGVSADRQSKEEASQMALEDCQSKRGASCKVDRTYDNQCAAVVVGDGGYNVGNAATVDMAVASGMKTCRDGGFTNCHAYYTACSFPVQVR